LSRRAENVVDVSAHACSEIGLKWFLFALHDPGTALDFASVDFFLDSVFLEHRRNGQNGTKTIFDQFRNTHARYHKLKAPRLQDNEEMSSVARATARLVSYQAMRGKDVFELICYSLVQRVGFLNHHIPHLLIVADS
jgi:hypothetical protein